MKRLEVIHLSKRYRKGDEPAVNDASFDLDDGKLLALVGESGSGKTTLLRMLAGLETPDAGEIRLDGATLSSPQGVVPPERRGIGLVFQSHALFPHLTVEGNIGFGVKHLDRTERAKVVPGMLDLVGLSGYQNRYPHELSGGERQRVALARALAPNPRLLLLDEPFSSLDARLRQSVRDETRSILRERGTTAVFVTHDTGDALTIADGIVVLKRGEVQQIGAPPEVYHAPSNSYVASFFGTCNFLPLRGIGHPSGARIACHIGPPNVGDPAGVAGIWVRPEDLELVAPEHTPRDGIIGVVSMVRFHGAYLDVELVCETPGHGPFPCTVWHHAPFMVNPGERWGISPKPRRN